MGKTFYGGPPKPPKKEKEPVTVTKTKAPVVKTTDKPAEVEENK